MKFSITASCRTGCVRKNNEDMALVGSTLLRNESLATQIDTSTDVRYLMAVADGMGGHNSGEVASSDVLHNLQYFFSDLPVGLSIGDFNEAIYEWLESINNIIDSKGRHDQRYSKMGTTLVAMACYGGEYYWMNCGDSRIYRLHGNSLIQLSTDHSLSNLMGASERSSIITNCIGGGCKNSFIDIIRFTADVKPGDTFLLCSDGLTDMLTDGEILHALLDGLDADELCQMAEAAGGRDNVSAIIARATSSTPLSPSTLLPPSTPSDASTTTRPAASH